MTKAIFIGFIALSLLAGCASWRTPQHTIVKNDSTVNNTVKTLHESDSSNTKETITTKVDKGATVDETFTEAQLAQIIAAMKMAPPNTVMNYKTDPNSKAIMKMMMDSIGRLHFICEASDRIYNEKLTEVYKSLKSREDNETVLQHKISDYESEIKILKESFWVQVKRFFSNGVWFMLIIMVAFTVVNFIIKTKNKIPIV